MVLETIKEKIEQLKKLDKELDIFGSDNHKYKIAPALSEEQILAYENKNGIRLPEDYRNYLLHVGNGGVGPFYGLYELGAQEGIEPNLTRPFPLGPDKQLKLFDVYEEIDAQLSEMNIENEDEADKMYEKLYEEICGDINCGFVFLCTEGCGMDSILIVNGEAYGTVWYFDFANEAGTFPLLSPETGAPMTFTDWYAVWLDSAINYLETGTAMFHGYASFILSEEETSEPQPAEIPEYFDMPVAYSPVLQKMGENFGQCERFGSAYDQQAVSFYGLRPKHNKFCVICSFGLGCFKFPENEKRCEVFMVIPAGWDAFRDDDEFDWPLSVMAAICTDIFDSKDIQPAGYIYGFGEPFANNTEYNSILIAGADFLGDNKFCSLENGEIVEFLQLIPMHGEECDYLDTHEDEDEALTAKLKQNYGMIDITRNSFI